MEPHQRHIQRLNKARTSATFSPCPCRNAGSASTQMAISSTVPSTLCANPTIGRLPAHLRRSSCHTQQHTVAITLTYPANPFMATYEGKQIEDLQP
jgi:hypothetical protein